MPKIPALAFASTRLMSLVFVTLFAAAHLTFLTYIVKIEKIPECECARHPYLTLVKIWSIFVVCFTALSMFGFLSADYLPAGLQPYLGTLGMLVSVASVVVYTLALRWIAAQVRIGCHCSAEIRRDVLKWWSILFLAGVIILMLLPFLVVITSGIGSVGSKASTGIRTAVAMTNRATGSVRKAVKDKVLAVVAAAKQKRAAARAPKRA